MGYYLKLYKFDVAVAARDNSDFNVGSRADFGLVYVAGFHVTAVLILLLQNIARVFIIAKLTHVTCMHGQIYMSVLYC